NEASGQKAPSKKHGLFISRPLNKMRSTSSLRVSGFMLTKLWLKKTLRNYFF
ncbi:MAG: hypothetical protein ACI819_002150, partial [Neolewinella sp.]